MSTCYDIALKIKPDFIKTSTGLGIYEPLFYPTMKEVFTNTGTPFLYIGSISPLERVYLDPTNQVYYIKYLAPWDTSIYTEANEDGSLTTTFPIIYTNNPPQQYINTLKAIDDSIIICYDKKKFLNTFLFKDILYTAMSHKTGWNDDKSRVYGYCRFTDWTNALDKNYECTYNKKYFKGLKSESKVFRLTRTKGYKPIYKQDVKRNEPLDCKVYSYAAARLVRNSIPSDHPLYENICKLWYPDE